VSGGDTRAVAPALPLTRMDNADPVLFAELMAAVERVASQAAFTLGPEVEAFEREFAEYCGTSQAIGVSSGTEALALTLRATDVGPGDEVLVPANSFIATAEAVTLVGATPRFVDVDPDSHTVTVEAIRAAITDRTRCVIPVHLYGRTMDLDEIVALGREHGFRVVEDACQAHGASHRGRRAGSVGDAGCFSFYPSKNLGAWGDGGAVVTSDPDLADRIRLLRSHGERPRYQHRVCGTTGRLDAIQAAVLRVKLRRLDQNNADRRRAAADLAEALGGAELELPAPVQPGGDHVFHQFVVTSDARDALRTHLSGHGIATGVHYPVPIHLSGAYRAASSGQVRLPVCERLAARVCSLPFWPSMDAGAIARVAEAVHTFQPARPAYAAA
jgi:dTDP-3-amino-3,4,6-trideoxy-alpha-D-glucose transaminase